ncbi:hypothetical protein BDV06DRAFT_197588 [Aspergillus oleicola]
MPIPTMKTITKTRTGPRLSFAQFLLSRTCFWVAIARESRAGIMFDSATRSMLCFVLTSRLTVEPGFDAHRGQELQAEQ